MLSVIWPPKKKAVYSLEVKCESEQLLNTEIPMGIVKRSQIQHTAHRNRKADCEMQKRFRFFAIIVAEAAETHIIRVHLKHYRRK